MPSAMRSLLFAALATSACAANSTYRPVAIMHGMNYKASDMKKIQDALEAKYPGIYTTSIDVYGGLSSIFTKMEPQMDAMVAAIRKDPNLKDGFNFYGESNGALLARAYVTLYNDPPVHNLVAMNGPQMGVGECPHIEVPVLKQLCGDLGTTLDIYHWPSCAFCGYWRGKDQKKYLDNSEWIADVNNQRQINETRRQNMLSLNKYMAIKATEDTTVQPADSALHTYWYWDQEARDKVMPLEETEDYKGDFIGIKTLKERGDFITEVFEGNHLRYNMTWWNEVVAPMFNKDA